MRPGKQGGPTVPRTDDTSSFVVDGSPATLAPGAFARDEWDRPSRPQPDRHRRRVPRTGAIVALAVPLAGAAAAAVTLDVAWTLRGAPARSAVEMAAVLIGLLAAYLLFDRAEAAGRGRQLALAWGAGLMAVVEGALSLLPNVVSLDLGVALVRVDAIARLLIAVVLAVAALAPAHVLDRAGRRTLSAMGLSLLGLPLVLVVIAADNAAGAATAAEPPWREPAYLVAALLALVAGAAFAVRAVRRGAELSTWIAGALVLYAGANLDAAFDPSLPPDWITTCDVLRYAAAALVLGGALRQLGAHPSRAARRAVAQERRRIARDLHDGLAQELAFIAAQAPRMAAARDDPGAARLAEAAASALEESRLAIGLLGDDSGESLGRALRRTGERLAGRTGRVVRVDLQEGVSVDPAAQGDLLRIAREAATNAFRHGDATEVSISLTRGDAVVLRIADDGVGFVPEAVIPGVFSGFGLTSMRERAERAGGQLHVHSEPGRGTVIEVRVG
jgi:signal transduction histidine kinase